VPFAMQIPPALINLNIPRSLLREASWVEHIGGDHSKPWHTSRMEFDSIYTKKLPVPVFCDHKIYLKEAERLTFDSNDGSDLWMPVKPADIY
jgi:hypothetical protein